MSSRSPSCRCWGGGTRRDSPREAQHRDQSIGDAPSRLPLSLSSWVQPLPREWLYIQLTSTSSVLGLVLAWGTGHMNERRQDPCPHGVARRRYSLLQRLGMRVSISLPSRIGRELNTQVFHFLRLRASDRPGGEKGMSTRLAKGVRACGHVCVVTPSRAWTWPQFMSTNP